MQQKVTAQIGANQISIETGKIAKLADGAVIVSSGDTIVLVSAVSAAAIKEGQDYFPLTVDYREKAAAAGNPQSAPLKRHCFSGAVECGPCTQLPHTDRAPPGAFPRSAQGLFGSSSWSLSAGST